MSVIINDFEVISEQEEQVPAPETNGEAPQPSPQPPPLRPMDVEEILRRQHLRQMRLRAH